MLWNNEHLRGYVKGLKKDDKVRLNYEAAMNHIGSLKPETAKEKCVCRINGVNHTLKHYTHGAGQYHVSIFFEFSGTDVVIWGLGSHIGSDNKRYSVMWSANTTSEVRLG